MKQEVCLVVPSLALRIVCRDNRVIAQRWLNQALHVTFRHVQEQ